MSLKIHFLNVGHGDCTIIEHESGNITMIDINNGEELDDVTASEIAETLGYTPEQVYNAAYQYNRSPYDLLKGVGYNRELTNPIEYFKANHPSKSIFRFIQTHPDLDHMRGLRCFDSENISITNFWDTDHTKEVDDFWFDTDKEDWEAYQSIRNGIYGAKLLKLGRGSSGNYWNTHPTHNLLSDGIYILAPTPELTAEANRTDKSNNHSYVLLLIYKGIKVIFGGDAEKEVWDSIVKEHAQVLSCHILKASHHGRESGFHEAAVMLMSPVYTVVSVGKKPATDAHDKYTNHTSEAVMSTRWYGNILVTIDDNGRYYINSQYNN